MMETIPPEVLSHIYSYACTDDGYTGRSLSLVSKYINRVSKPYKFQSVAVRGMVQMIKFANVLAGGMRDEEQNGVRHLFLSCDRVYDFGGAAWSKRKDHREESRTAVVDFDPLSSLSNLVDLLYYYFFPDQEGIAQAKADAKRISDEAELRDRHSVILYYAFHCIMDVVAPNIQTLSVAVQHGFLPNTPSNLDVDPDTKPESGQQDRPFKPRAYPIFPYLTELTISHPHDWAFPAPADFPIQQDCFPSLQRVDLSGVGHYMHPVNVLANIPVVAPTLTHICLPIIESMHIQHFADHMDNALVYINQPYPVDVFGKEAEKFPETVEKVFVQLAPKRDIFTALLEYYVEGFRAVMRKDERFAFVQRKGLAVEADPLEQEKKWLDRLEGGEGCWSLAGGIISEH